MKNRKQPFRFDSPGRFRIKEIDPEYSEDLEKEDAKKRTLALCRRIGELQEYLAANANQALLILFQGMDTSGKDGATKRVLESVNPAGVETTCFKAPSTEERAHDYLWRVHRAVPRNGIIGVFNRSHYEEVLVVRVMGLQSRKIWKKRFDQINAFEKHLAENRVVLLKFFLHISKDEQKQRLEARLEDPRKNWKFSTADLQMRDHWGTFQKAYEDVVRKCSTPWAPWHVIPANRKWYRDYLVARVVCDALEKMQLDWPRPLEDLSQVKIP